MKTYFEVPIRRRTEKEALQAIDDLEKRGFTISSPLKEVKSSIYSKGSYDYKKSRFTSSGINDVSCWMAKMRRDD